MARNVAGPQITGQVTSKQTGGPLGGVTVTVSPTVYTDPELTAATTTLTTSGTGGFSCYAPPGQYTFTCAVAAAAPIEPVEVLGIEEGTGGPLSGVFLTQTAARASYAPVRSASIDASSYTGYDSTGATDSTAAITAALTAAAAWGVREVTLIGSPKSTGIVAPAAGMRISGGGSKSGTTLQLVGVGPLIATGTDDGAAVGASDYTGQDYLTVEGIKLAVVSPTTNLDNGYGTYTPNTVAVQDWRGGNVRLLDVRMFNFDIPFQGPSSDLDDWDNVELNQCHRGLHIQSRSDQFAAANVRAFYCDQVLDLDSVNSVILDKLNIYACGVPMTATTFSDLATTTANAVITSVTATFAATDVGVAVSGPGIPDQTIILSVSGNTATLSNNATATATGQTLTMYRSGGRAPIVIRSSDTNRPTTSVVFRQPHFESTPGADSSHVKLYESMIEIAVGDSVTTRNVHLQRPDVRTGTISSFENIQYLVKVDNADGVVIDDPSYWGQDMQWMTGLALLVGATGSTAHRSRHRTAMTSQQRNAVRIVSRSTASAATQPRWLREVYGYTVTAGIPGPYRGEMVSETGMLRRVTDSVNNAVYDQYYDVINGIGASLQWGAGNTTGSGTVRWALPFGFHLNDGAGNDFIGYTVAAGLSLAPKAGEKLGFFGTAPVIKQTATPADATDLASAIALANALKAKLVAYGLIA